MTKHIGEEAILSLAIEVLDQLIPDEERYVDEGGGNDTLRALQYLRVLALREVSKL